MTTIDVVCTRAFTPALYLFYINVPSHSKALPTKSLDMRLICAIFGLSMVQNGATRWSLQHTWARRQYEVYNNGENDHAGSNIENTLWTRSQCCLALWWILAIYSNLRINGLNFIAIVLTKIRVLLRVPLGLLSAVGLLSSVSNFGLHAIQQLNATTSTFPVMTEKHHKTTH